MSTEGIEQVELLNKDAAIDKLRIARSELQVTIAELEPAAREAQTNAINSATTLVEALSKRNINPAELATAMIGVTLGVMKMSSVPAQRERYISALRRFDEGIALLEISGEDDCGNIAVPTVIASKIKDLILDSNAAVNFDPKALLAEATKCCGKAACAREAKAPEAIEEQAAENPFDEEFDTEEAVRETVPVGSNYAAGDHDNDGDVGV